MYKYSVSVLYLSMWARSDSGPCVERMFQEYREHPAELICNTGGSGGIRTHASEETGTTQRRRKQKSDNQ